MPHRLRVNCTTDVFSINLNNAQWILQPDQGTQEADLEKLTYDGTGAFRLTLTHLYAQPLYGPSLQRSRHGLGMVQ
jgi:hypothetical protein